MKLRGLAQRAPDRTVMVLPHCRDVHTFTMRHPLDIAFVSEDGLVVAVYRLVLPGVRLRHRQAAAVVERFARPGAWFEKGDSIELPSRCVGKRGIRGRGLRRSRRRIPWN